MNESPGFDDLEDAVHVGGMDAVEVDRVRVRARVRQVDAEDVVLGRPDDRPGHGAVVRPGLEEDAGRDLDRAVDGSEVVLADSPRLVGEGRRGDSDGVLSVRPAWGGHLGADHRRVAVVWPVVAEMGGGALPVRSARPGELRQRRGSHERERSRQHLLPGQIFSHVEFLS